MDELKKYEICSFDGCEREQYSRGLCLAHYRQWRAGKELAPTRFKEPNNWKKETCSFPSCDRVTKGKGLCPGHYHQQWRGEELKPLRVQRGRSKYGSSKNRVPVKTRLLSHVTRDESMGCLLWNKAISVHGYGVLNIKETDSSHVHRTSYETFIGPIPRGRVVDHICGVRNCIEPSHLRAVTKTQNAQYHPGIAAGTIAASGHMGVHYNESSGYWQAKFYLDGKCEFVGSYDTVEDAAFAVRARRAEICDMGDPETNREYLRQLWLDRRNDPVTPSPSV